MAGEQLTMRLYLGYEDGPPVTSGTGELRPVLERKDDTILVWEEHRRKLRRDWLQALGPVPLKIDPVVKVLAQEPQPDHVRYLLQYRTEPGMLTEAYLLVPVRRHGRVPGAVVFHGTTDQHIRQPVGLADGETRHLALHLVRRGYVTLCPRCFVFRGKDDDWGTLDWTRPRGSTEWAEAAQALLQRRPGASGMSKMLWDAERALDLLESRPEVDPTRMVCVGHSLGGKQALYLAAFDDRVRATIASEAGIGLSLSNWDAPWYLGARLPVLGPGRDHHELISLAAPRGFLVVGGGASDGPQSWPYVLAARPAYALYRKSDAAALLVHDGVHDLPNVVREKAFDWLNEAIVWKAPTTTGYTTRH